MRVESGRRPLALIGVAALLVASSMPVLADGPDRIELPNGWSPEGITALNGQLYVGSRANGAIWRADPVSGDGELLVPGVDGTVAFGVEAEAAHDRLWVAGGATGHVRAYDAQSGELLATYSIDAGFLNDVVATPDAIYVTDSFLPQLVVIPLGADGSLPDKGMVSHLDLTGEIDYSDDGFNANGIVATPAGLVTVLSQEGLLYLIDPASGSTERIDTGGTDLTFGDGLELNGQTLYVVRNQLSTIVALELDPSTLSASALGELTSPDLDVPATAALVDGDLWAANARFGTPARADTAYWLTRLDTSLAAGSDQPTSP